MRFFHSSHVNEKRQVVKEGQIFYSKLDLKQGGKIKSKEKIVDIFLSVFLHCEIYGIKWTSKGILHQSDFCAKNLFFLLTDFIVDFRQTPLISYTQLNFLKAFLLNFLARRMIDVIRAWLVAELHAQLCNVRTQSLSLFTIQDLYPLKKIVLRFILSLF